MKLLPRPLARRLCRESACYRAVAHLGVSAVRRLEFLSEGYGAHGCIKYWYEEYGAYPAALLKNSKIWNFWWD